MTKTTSLKSILLFSITIVSNFAMLAQSDIEKLTAYYSGYKNNVYTFSYIEEATREKEVISFHSVAADLLEEYNLQKEFFEGVHFNVVYTTIKNDGNYHYRILKLKEIKEAAEKDIIISDKAYKADKNNIANKVVKEKLTAHYMGYKNKQYTFSTTGTKEMVSFQSVDSDLMQEYNLHKEFFEGVHFQITYTTTTKNNQVHYRILALKELAEKDLD